MYVNDAAVNKYEMPKQFLKGFSLGTMGEHSLDTSLTTLALQYHQQQHCCHWCNQDPGVIGTTSNPSDSYIKAGYVSVPGVHQHLKVVGYTQLPAIACDINEYISCSFPIDLPESRIISLFWCGEYHRYIDTFCM